MGKRNPIAALYRKTSFKFRFVFYSILAGLLSILFTFLFLEVINYLLFDKGLNILKGIEFYEKKIENIEKYVIEKEEGLFDKKNKKELENIIFSNLQKSTYQVCNKNGNILYGTFNNKVIDSNKNILYSINKTIKIEKYLKEFEEVKIIPIVKKDKIVGFLNLKYTADGIPDKKYEIVLMMVGISIVTMPFILTFLFTVIFSTQYIKKIKKPVNQLIDAADNIKKKNLDYSIKYEYENEFTPLFQAFDEMRNELKASLEKQWKIEKDKKDMIKVLAHDLKTPIAIIQGHLEVLSDGSLNNRERTEKYINTIKNNLDKMSKMINDINIASEIESQDFKLNKIEINIQEYFDFKKEDYFILTKKNNRNFVFNFYDERSDKKKCYVDPVKLEQILNNLLSNAIRYTPDEKSIIMNVKVEEDMISFIIEDEGKGFEAKDIPYVFDKFYRGDYSRNSGKGHCGLGLYVVKTLVEKHGGRIYAENCESGGARIGFFIHSRK